MANTTKTSNSSKTKAISIFVLIILAELISQSSASAHRDPADCTGSGLGIALFTDVPSVHIGDVISYSVMVFNNGATTGPTVCNATGITANITTPDGKIHPIALTRTDLKNLEKDTYANIVKYTSQAADVKAGGTLTATASDTGTIHQNDTDSIGGGNQGVNVSVISAPPVVVPPVTTPTPSPSPSSSPTPVVTPTTTPISPTVTPITPVTPPPPPHMPPPPPVIVTTSSSGGSSGTPVIFPTIKLIKSVNIQILPATGGNVIYTYIVTNPGRIALNNVSVIDDKCAPLTFIFGDINANGLLDTTETWNYICQTNLVQATTNIGVATGYANGMKSTSTSTATVVLAAPYFPRTGLAPRDEANESIWEKILSMFSRI